MPRKRLAGSSCPSFRSRDSRHIEPSDGSLIATGNTDGDAAVELATGYNSSSATSALYVTDSATMLPGPRYWGPDGTHTITAIAVGDVGGDGADEIYMALNDSSGRALIYRAPNRASLPGTLVYGPNANWFITALAIGDTDGNGSDELFTAFNAKSGAASIYRSTDGLGTGPRIYGPVDLATVTALAIADIDANFTAELYIAELQNTRGTRLLRRLGNGTLTEVMSEVQGAVIPAMAAGRIDAGPVPELMIAMNHDNAGAEIRRGYRSTLGLFLTEVTFSDPSWRASSMGTGDVDADGLDDLYIGFDTPTGSAIRRLDGTYAGSGTQVWSDPSFWRN